MFCIKCCILYVQNLHPSSSCQRIAPHIAITVLFQQSTQRHRAWIAQSHLSSYIRQKERKTVKDQSLCLSKVNNKKENEREIGLPRSLSLSFLSTILLIIRYEVHSALQMPEASVCFFILENHSATLYLLSFC